MYSTLLWSWKLNYILRLKSHFQSKKLLYFLLWSTEVYFFKVFKLLTLCQFLIPFINFMTLWIGFRAHFAREKYCRACARMSFRPRVPSPRCESWRFTGERIWRHCLNYLKEEINPVPCTGKCLRNMTNCQGFVEG